MPTIATIVRVDEVYREVNRIPASQEVDYGQTVTWSGHSVPLGRLANFYRALEQRYGSIGRAVLSEESFEFMRTGQIPELR
jgi:hypothetical protein